MSLVNLQLPCSARMKCIRFLRLFITLLMLGSHVSVYANELGSFQRIETETLDDKEFIFPDDFKGQSLNIVMLAMAVDQENGEWQGEELKEWYAELADQGVLTDEVLGYHFSVMKVPWFIKGLVRNGMAKSYADKMPLSQAGTIFTKDLEGFAAAPGIPLNGQPALVLVTPDGKLVELFQGEVTPDNLEAVSQAIKAYTQSQ